jgi:hypothetical protein
MKKTSGRQQLQRKRKRKKRNAKGKESLSQYSMKLMVPISMTHKKIFSA